MKFIKIEPDNTNSIDCKDRRDMFIDLDKIISVGMYNYGHQVECMCILLDVVSSSSNKVSILPSYFKTLQDILVTHDKNKFITIYTENGKSYVINMAYVGVMWVQIPSYYIRIGCEILCLSESSYQGLLERFMPEEKPIARPVITNPTQGLEP